MYDKKNPKDVNASPNKYDLFTEDDEEIEEEFTSEEEELSSGYSLQLIHHLITETPPEDRRRRWLLELRRAILSDEGEFRERNSGDSAGSTPYPCGNGGTDRKTHFTRKSDRDLARIAERRHCAGHRRWF